MKNLKYLFVFMLALIMLVSTTVPAFADNGKVDYSNPAVQRNLFGQMQKAKDLDKFIAQLSPEGQRAAIELCKVVTIERSTIVRDNSNVLTQSTSAALSSAPSFTFQYDGKNALGIVLWSFYERVTTVSNGRTFTRADQPIVWGTTRMAGWRYDGVQSTSTSGGVGSTWYTAFAQGSFTLGLGGWDVQHCYPWISLTFYANGGYRWEWGG